MTSLSDFPPDVQATAQQAHAEFASAGCRDNLGAIIARAIMADRSQRINMTGLTSQQGNCLRAIAAHQAQHGGQSPTFEELATALGLASKSGVLRLLMALEKRGRILRPANTARAATIIANPAN